MIHQAFFPVQEHEGYNMSLINPQTDLEAYRNTIHLDQPFKGAAIRHLSLDERSKIINELIKWLANEDNGKTTKQILREFKDQRLVLRALLNIRKPKPLDAVFLDMLNCLLQTDAYEKEIVKVGNLASVAETIPTLQGGNGDNLVLWQGDITRLAIDAIVNAANSQLLGCFHPLHACIDNAIHTYAGPQLREDCHSIMRIQGAPEKTGYAKITRAYNLPAKFVLHTVGPIVPQGISLTDEHRVLLASCYISCLELASRVKDIRNIAFCAISTGVFGFPRKEAAQIAVNTIGNWIDKHPTRFDKIPYCVFSKEDYREYFRAFHGE